MFKKIAIIGSGGVGSTLAFTILQRIPPQELVLVDILKDFAKGIALDLEDTRKLFHFSTAIDGTEDYSALRDSDIVVLTAGVARKPGMSRTDLLKINGDVTAQASRFIQTYSPQSLVIVVTNPLDLITYIVTKETKFERSRVLGMGSSLDTARLLTLVWASTGIAIEKIEGLVLGLHSNEMIVSRNRIQIDGKPAHNYFNNNELDNLTKRVQLRGAEIVNCLKNRSAQFGPAAACCQLLEAIAHDTNELICVSVLLQGEYNLNDICLGVPCRINRSGINKIIELELTADEKNELRKAEQFFKQCMISQ